MCIINAVFGIVASFAMITIGIMITVGASIARRLRATVSPIIGSSAGNRGFLSLSPAG